MNLIKETYIRIRLKRDKNFLIGEGLRKAREEGIEVRIGVGSPPASEENKKIIYLESYEKGVDVRELIALVADDFPDITRRYLSDRRKLAS